MSKNWRVARRDRDTHAAARKPDGPDESTPDDASDAGGARTDDLLQQAEAAGQKHAPTSGGTLRDPKARGRSLREQLLAESEAHQQAVRRQLEAFDRGRRAEHALDLSQIELDKIGRALTEERATAERERRALAERDQAGRDEAGRELEELGERLRTEHENAIRVEGQRLEESRAALHAALDRARESSAAAEAALGGARET